jgi:hypothetical protein
MPVEDARVPDLLRESPDCRRFAGPMCHEDRGSCGYGIRFILAGWDPGKTLLRAPRGSGLEVYSFSTTRDKRGTYCIVELGTMSLNGSCSPPDPDPVQAVLLESFRAAFAEASVLWGRTWHRGRSLRTNPCRKPTPGPLFSFP